jgi:hypothetical protein
MTRAREGVESIICVLHTAPMASEREPDDGHEDNRGAEPPAQQDADDADSAGPQGNPEVDEEAVQHGQQEADQA